MLSLLDVSDYKIIIQRKNKMYNKNEFLDVCQRWQLREKDRERKQYN